VTTETIGRESRRVINGTAGWAPARWRLKTGEETGVGDGDTRATVMIELIQKLADLAADAEGRPRRVVPPPDHDTGLCDQLAVMSADLLGTDPDESTRASALAAIRQAHRQLFAG